MNDLVTAHSMTKVLYVELLDNCRAQQPVNTIYCLSNISNYITVSQNAKNDMESSMKSCLNGAVFFLSIEQYVTVFGLDVYYYYYYYYFFKYIIVMAGDFSCCLSEGHSVACFHVCWTSQ